MGEKYCTFGHLIVNGRFGDSMRKLAHIETIREIIPHGNADSLEICKILGWTCVVLKGQFKVGEQVVFVEPDAILPEGRSEWEFMRARHFRVKTIRLRGVISQGLVFKEEILDNPMTYGPRLIGDDVTDLLGITKYQPYIPAQLAGTVKGSFPEFLHKTDEMRIQAVPELLEKHQGKKFYITEKLDGSSMTVYLNNGEFGVCSRNMELKETEGNAYWKVARELDLQNKLSSFGVNIALQGELIGMGVQGNKYKLSNLQFFVFNIFDIDKSHYLNYNDPLWEWLDGVNLERVPQLGIVDLNFKTIDELVEFSKGKSLLNKDIPREGIVLRPLVEEYDDDLRGRLSFKVINPIFLLEQED